MASTNNKSALDFMLQSVLAIANKEANMDFPPRVFSQMYNIATSFIKKSLCKSYPGAPENIDILDPFVQVAVLPCTSGFVQLPDNYSDILGTPMIFANPNSTGECASEQPPLTSQSFKIGALKAGCNMNAVTIVPQSEFADLTSSSYLAPTYAEPIGYFSGAKQIRVCPFDLKRIAVMYARNELIYNYGYILQPDDTYIFNINDPATVETEWNSNCFEYLFRAVTKMYGAYAKDPDMNNWSNVLTKEGIL